MRINHLGEAKIIELIGQTVKKRNKVLIGIGDDACVLKDGQTVVTTDSYAQGVHFDLSYMSYRDVGTHCACACLSDVVAMGAQPIALLVALALPSNMPVDELRQLYKGLDFVCNRLNCEIVGGDIIAFDQPVLTLTALGKTSRPLLRAAAKPKDFLCITGFAGLSETGRLLLAQGKTASRYQRATVRHLCPLPRIKVMTRLRRRINALIDTSDGIATDARHIAEMSRVRIVIQPELIPIHPVTRALTKKLGIDTVRFCLTAGEDYELLFTTNTKPPSRIDNTPITIIGRVETGTGVYLEQKGTITPLPLHGYDHFQHP
ncbi:thiamine-phosphate kinase [candidate division WOR-3 bacterium]|nr:thiamine-phosphate kinase [candidate division WOR-3 bacterium]